MNFDEINRATLRALDQIHLRSKDDARGRLVAMEAAIAAHPCDGEIYEDDYVVVKRVGGQVTMTGKPFRLPFYFEEA